MRPLKRKSAAREHVLILNGMRPSEDNSAAPKGSFAAPEHVNPKLTLDILDSRMKSKKKKKKGLKVKKWSAALENFQNRNLAPEYLQLADP